MTVPFSPQASTAGRMVGCCGLRPSPSTGRAGIEVTRYLISEKLRGQAVLLGRLGRARRGLHSDGSGRVGGRSGVVLRGPVNWKRRGANVYFAVLERGSRSHSPGKTTGSRALAPFNGRRSTLDPVARAATDAGSILNYGYKLAEIEAGWRHAWGLTRDWGSCTPLGRSTVLRLRPHGGGAPGGRSPRARWLDGPLRKREFTEDPRGVVRCLAPITHRLAEAMPSYALTLGPVTEQVADILAGSPPTT